MTNKDLNLLRPFDLEAAKRGEPVVQVGGDVFKVRWVARDRDNKTNIVEKDGAHGGLLTCVGYAIDDWLRMAPLGWVEGRPVYPGDELFYKAEYNSGRFIAKSRHESEGVIFGRSFFDSGTVYDHENSFEKAHRLTWTKPVRIVKREGWIKISKPEIEIDHPRFLAGGSPVFRTEEDAKTWPRSSGLVVKIEWEEPEGA